MGSEQVSEFIKRVENLYETEYGDFKRKLGTYINHLEQNFQDGGSRKIIGEMRQQVIYAPTGNVEDARGLTIALAKKL